MAEASRKEAQAWDNYNYRKKGSDASALLKAAKASTANRKAAYAAARSH